MIYGVFASNVVLCEQNVTNTTEDEQNTPAVLLFFSFGHQLWRNSTVVSSLPVEGVMGTEVTQTYPVINEPLLSQSTKSPTDPTMIFFSMDYGRFVKV